MGPGVRTALAPGSGRVAEGGWGWDTAEWWVPLPWRRQADADSSVLTMGTGGADRDRKGGEAWECLSPLRDSLLLTRSFRSFPLGSF